jgi:HSP20 family protein
MVIDFSPLYDVHRNFDRLLGSVLSPSQARGRQAYPPMNISEDDNHIYVRMEAPGLEIDDIEITLVESSLAIRGERKAVRGKYYRQERPVGAFQRLVSLNTPVDREAVKASLKDGLLTVALPKAEESKPRKITIGG